jgi:hypothetical protein
VGLDHPADAPRRRSLGDAGRTTDDVRRADQRRLRPVRPVRLIMLVGPVRLVGPVHFCFCRRLLAEYVSAFFRAQKLLLFSESPQETLAQKQKKTEKAEKGGKNRKKTEKTEKRK